MSGACCLRGELCLAKVEIEGLFCIFLNFLCLLWWWVGVCVYTHVHTRTLLEILDESPGVGQAPGGLEELRSTTALYTCTPHMCTQYICPHTCWAADDNLG